MQLLVIHLGVGAMSRKETTDYSEGIIKTFTNAINSDAVKVVVLPEIGSQHHRVEVLELSL